MSKLIPMLALVLVAVVARLLPHPPNFTPIAALALFAGSVALRPIVAAGLVLAVMLISDLFLGFHSVMPAVYGCLMVNVWLGSKLLGRGSSRLAWAQTARIGGASLAGSVLFFAVTNLACWFWIYPPTLSGLVACYTSAIPFFQYTVMGDLAYSALFFGAYAVSTAKVPALVRQASA